MQRQEGNRGPWRFRGGTQWTALQGAPELVCFTVEDAALLEAALSMLADMSTDKPAEAQDLLNRLKEMRGDA